jgi:hypothetical protein
MCLVQVTNATMSRMDVLVFVSNILFDLRSEELQRENQHTKRPLRVQRRWPIKKDHLTKGEPFVYFDEWKAVDMLAVASKAFMDKRFLELKNENERLKLERFWKSYGPEQFIKQLSSFHWRSCLFHCGCVSCVEHNRFEPPAPHLVDQNMVEWTATAYANERWEYCRYLPWFREFLDDIEDDFGELDIGHIHICGTKHWFWRYGSKFSNARSVADPNLRTLEAIFDALYCMSKCK